MGKRRLVFAITMLLCSTATRAVPILLESAGLGPTGQPTAGLILANTQWGGWRFDIDQRLEVRQIGGHLTTLRGTLFGALVSVNSSTGLPDFKPSEIEGDAIAGVTFDSGAPSQDFRTRLNVMLEPGSYALVFGGGEDGGSGDFPNEDFFIVHPPAFGSTGAGRMPFDNIPIPGASDASRFFFANTSDIWIPLDPTSTNSIFRFVVEGNSRRVSEPSTLFLLVGTSLAAFLVRYRSHGLDAIDAMSPHV